MKPIEVYAQAHPAELTNPIGAGDITIQTMAVNLFSGTGPQSTRIIASLDELEAFAAEVAAAFGKPCAVWMGLKDRKARKPPGFGIACDKVAAIFRDPSRAVAS